MKMCLVLIGGGIMVFYAGVFCGAWWINRAFAIQNLSPPNGGGEEWPRNTTIDEIIPLDCTASKNNVVRLKTACRR